MSFKAAAVGASCKSPSTPYSANLMIISNIANYPVLGGIKLVPPSTPLKGNTLIFDELAISAVAGELHEAFSIISSGKDFSTSHCVLRSK